MPDEPDDLAASSELPEIARRVRTLTPARLLAGRCGAAYRTHTQMELRRAHAAARDAVRAELDLEQDLGTVFVDRWRLFEVSTQAKNKDEYLLRPDLGRRFNAHAREQLAEPSRVPRCADLQIAIGDGLSVTAVSKQVPSLLDFLVEGSRERGWKIGQPFVIRHCRVGILNEIGELLAPRVAVLLIGERPGLATSESLSAYLAYRPDKGHTDANRNLISNIHTDGVQSRDAARRIIDLAAAMMTTGSSGYHLREEFPSIESSAR
jgi:ethanolamine ammonia-lyase small subunit